MSQPPPNTSTTTEKTFTAYTPEQAKGYVQARLNYHPNVYQAVLNHHTSTGGKLTTLLDIGCGPGLAVRSLAPHFQHAIGLDPSQGMITTARSLDPTSSIRFEVSTAESLGSDLQKDPVKPGSVDLLVASNAAHWFDLPKFWLAAARILKPGGTVAFWTSGPIDVHPSMPNAVALQEAMDAHEKKHIEQYYAEGNWHTRDRYARLVMPWSVDPPVGEFDEGQFVRREWDDEADGPFFMDEMKALDLDAFEKAYGSASPYVRWREAHPGDVGTERDTIKILRAEIEKLLWEAGVEKGKERLKGKVKGVILFVKKNDL
ncbi:S-adenosyl-L-methionine-dependent methyltransferase [Apodospora peruviana]|uniref:S-adenosyl-L-methionine-dependent methyltransferase n=1 Tax=Apodospora peruviana TaxID=516989 RepID=A0AAE0HU98_9PEZI|nr:S-adenosyl-L-methionine-dependent methyltransferase [Apodospora peruviana]